MDELIYSVKEVFSDFLRKELTGYYNIPEYQRGYKWNEANIVALLNDIEKFRQETGNAEATFYCLQNITLVKNTNANCFHVVDGQQRLTTLLILLSFLQHETDSTPLLLENKLQYSIRPETHEFITKQVLTGHIWEKETVPERKDQYYIREVARSIQAWFKENTATDKGKFLEILLSRVKLIVNVVDDKEEKIFSSLNGGKVNLDGADLLRAILMTRAAKEKYHGTSATSEVREFRIRMGMELDLMNLWFGKTADYFRQFISDQTIGMARINRFDFTTLPINLLYLLYYEYRRNEKESLNFSFFEYGKNSNGNPDDDRWEMYLELQEMYAILQRWYNDKELYHYLGFLFFNFKAQTPFRDIYTQWKTLNSRDKFLKDIQHTIATRMLDRYLEETEKAAPDYQKCLKTMTEAISDFRENWYNNDKELYQILILLDIFRILDSKSIKKLPTDYFTRKSGQKDGEDKEHILSQTPRKDNGEITTIKTDWEKFAQSEDFKDIRSQMQDILNHSDAELTEQELIQLQNLLNSAGLNSIGNMVLLDLRINRSYGNADYAHKRTIIFQEYMNQKYVRPHTLAVFMKGDIDTREATGIPLNRWTLEDIKRNTDKIAKEIGKNFNAWLTQNN